VARSPCRGSSGLVRQSQGPRASDDCDGEGANDIVPYFGDKPGPITEDHFRIGSINLNNTLQDVEGDERLFRDIIRMDIKVLCMQEVGCNWAVIPKHQAFQERLNRVFGPHDTRSCFKYNVHDLAGTMNQWGGTGVMSRGKLKHYAMGAGGDPSGLGRWTWARI
jgi:hypothetical protein